MRKKLAIKGHSTRGKEVIELLEMMGGKSRIPSGAILDRCIYTNIEGNILELLHYNANEFVIFTLEEFLEKYPFKVGDKVVYTKFGDNCDNYPIIIKSMIWTGTTIEYAFDGYMTCLAKDLKLWEEKSREVISGIYLNSCDYADEVELNLGDYEIEVRDGRTYAVKKKLKYPDNYEECVRIAKNIHGYYINIDAPAYRGLMESFIKLLICRDAYWKIAGKEMGLDKPWNSTYGCGEWGYWLGYSINENKIYLQDSGILVNHTFVFPTAEMRDAFYKNFKELIEQCKELL